MIKNEKQRKIEQVFHEYSGLKKARWIHKVIMMKCKRIFVSTAVRGKIQHENRYVMFNITFLILSVISGFFIQIPFPYCDKSKILVHTTLNLRNTEKPLFKCL